MAIRIKMCVSDSSIFVTELTVLCCVFVVFVVFVVVVVIGIVTCGIYTRKPGRFRFDSNRIRTKNAQFCHWNGVPNKVLLREPTWKISMHVGYMLRIICHEMKNGIEWNNPLHVCGAMCFFLPYASCVACKYDCLTRRAFACEVHVLILSEQISLVKVTMEMKWNEGKTMSSTMCITFGYGVCVQRSMKCDQIQTRMSSDKNGLDFLARIFRSTNT